MNIFTPKVEQTCGKIKVTRQKIIKDTHCRRDFSVTT